MSRKLTREQFIERANAKHGVGRFDYSRVVYINTDTKVEIGCNKCGDWFWQTPYSHGNKGCSCSNCSGKKRLTTDIFIKRATKIHGLGSYDYSYSIYLRSKSKVKIKCNSCNITFEQLPCEHLKGKGCRKCSAKKRGEKRKFTTEIFIKKAIQKHGGKKYGYEFVQYENSHSYVKIKCNKCNLIFKQKACEHLQGKGCAGCAGRKKLTTQEFIERAQKINGIKKFDYTKVKYVTSKDEVKIKCNTCNSFFLQRASTHLKGGGCGNCLVKEPWSRIKPTTITFIYKAKKKHGALKFNYELVNYVDSKCKVTIICNKCSSSFNTTPNNHLKGYGCPICAKTKKLTTKEFIKRAINKHGENKYDYSRVEYINSHVKVEVKCNQCNQYFKQSAGAHLSGQGCKTCSYERLNRFKFSNTLDFIKKAIKVHGRTNFNYSKVVYVKSNIKVKIKCNDCEKYFHQSPSGHLSGNGCPNCKSSKGERKIFNYLDSIIFFETQKTFPRLKLKNRLKCDFYIPSLKLIIEYDGEQHYRVVESWGGKKAFQETQKRDAIKNKFAKDNGYHLLRIPYTQFNNIESILESKLKELGWNPNNKNLIGKQLSLFEAA